MDHFFTSLRQRCYLLFSSCTPSLCLTLIQFHMLPRILRGLVLKNRVIYPKQSWLFTLRLVIPISLPTFSPGFRKRDNTECLFGPYVPSSSPLGLYHLFSLSPYSLYSQLPFQSSNLSSEVWTCHPGTHFQRFSNTQ